MANLIIGILIILLAVAIIAEYKIYQDKKANINKETKTIEDTKEIIEEITEEKVSELDKYNAIITLSNQMTLNNFLLFLILLILFVTLILPLILMGTEINKLIEAINNLLNA